MTAAAAAVAAVDPGHVLGPYPDLVTRPLTFELYAFETWRVGRIYNSDEPQADLAKRLLLVTDPLFHTFTLEETFGYSHVLALLTYGPLTAADFPDFCLRDYLRRYATDTEAWDPALVAFKQAWLAVARDLTAGES